MKKIKTIKGWGLLNLTNSGIKITEVVIEKNKPHYGCFYDGEVRSHIIPVKISYILPKIKKNKDYWPRSETGQRAIV